MKCLKCGAQFLEPEGNRCPVCGVIITPGIEERSGPDWEKRSSFLDAGAIFRTVKACLLEPSRTFSTMREEGDLTSPLIYGALLGTIGSVFGFIWGQVFRGTMTSMMAEKLPSQIPFQAQSSLLGLILSPVIVVVVLFIFSGIYHLMLMIVGGATRGFESTFRAVAYSTGSASLFQIVPLCGSIAGGIWTIVITIIGLREMHKTSTGKAVAAVLLPVVLCCGCAIAAMVFFGLGVSNLPRMH